MWRSIFIALPLLCSGVASAAPAQSDMDFVARIAEGDLAQVKLAKLALDRSASPTVKQLAQRMIDDHQRSYNDLSQLALAEGMPFPSTEAGNQKLLIEDVARLQGDTFDRAYLGNARAMQSELTGQLSSERAVTQNPALASYVDRALPTMRRDDLQAQRDVNRM